MAERIANPAPRDARAPFAWLPDARLDPHPRRTWLVECAFDLALHALFRRVEIVPRDYALEPGTLVVSNHQRDADVPLITAALCGRQGLRLRWPLPFPASREDMFRPGFLGELLAHWPRPLPALLARVPLAWLFRVVRAQPMRRLREFSIGEALAACAAEPGAPHAPEAALNARGRREVWAALGALPGRIDALLGARELAALRRRPWGLRRLGRAARRALLPGLRADIEAQLARFAALLDAGRVVYFAAEGGISESGLLGRFREGMWRVSRLAASPPAVLPAALSFDPFGRGRTRALVHVGAPLRGLDLGDVRAFNASLRRAIVRLYAVTPSHLASRYLSVGPARFTSEALGAWMRRAAQAARDDGLSVDPLLAGGSHEALAARRLTWLARKRLVSRDGAGWVRRWPRESAPGWTTPAAMARYLDHALEALAAEAPRFAACLQP